jgi:SAM-dependent methyltransferase
MLSNLQALQAHDRIYSEADYEWIPQDCPICGPKPKQFLGYRGGNAHRMKLGVRCSVWRCTVCNLIFPNPMPVPRKGLGQHYDIPPEDYFYGHEQLAAARYVNMLIEEAEQLSNMKGRLLDVGSGRGGLARAAKSRGWQVVAIEPSAVFARTLKQDGIQVVEKPVEECELPDGVFDVVICSAVLEHLYNPDRAIHSISRLLCRGGILFFDVPNEHGLYFLIGNLYARLRRKNATVNLSPTFAPYHIFGFSPGSLKRLLKKHGLQPIRWRVKRGKTGLPRRGGVLGVMESSAVEVVNLVSSVGQLGSVIETWAQKS